MKSNLALMMFTEELSNRNYSVNSIKRYHREARDFLIFTGKEDVRDIGKDDVERYQKEIYSSGRYSAMTRRGIMNTLERFFRFLSRNDFILVNPFAGMDLAVEKTGSRRESVAEEKLAAFLDSIAGNSFTELRDRAVFELMYGSGLRVGETVKLDMTDVDFQAGRVFVREGKGRKDRVAPLGSNALSCVKKYVETGRCYLSRIIDSEALFLTIQGKRLTVNAVEYALSKRFRKIDGEAKICPHMIRHSFATHMLEAGAGIKHVKDILGHKSLQSTVIYTHFNVKSMKRLLRRYHPRENELYEEIDEDGILKNLKAGI